MSASTPTSPDAPQTVGLASLPAVFHIVADVVNVAQAFILESTFFQKATFWGYEGFQDETISGTNFVSTPQDNSKWVEIGWYHEDADGDPLVQMPRKLLPGESLVIEAPPGQKLDLSLLQFKTAVITDGVFVEYS